MSDLADAARKRPARAIEADDDFDAINALYLERGWGDGLPIVPPTAERVEQMLAYCDRPWNEPIAKIAPRYGEATPLRLAANAVMAGCRPEYFPLFMLAIEAMCEEPFNLYGMQATTHPCAPLVIVNGPVARELGINGGHNAFGPGDARRTRRSAARCGSRCSTSAARFPGSGDMSTLGAPSKYSYFVAENEEASPWEPLHVERGFPRGGDDGDGGRRRMPAQRQRPREPHRRRHPHDDRRHDGDDRQQRHVLRRAAARRVRSRAREDGRRRRLLQSRREALPAGARERCRWTASRRRTSSGASA